MKNVLSENMQKKIIDLDTKGMRERILRYEHKMDMHPDSVKGKELDVMCPLKHTFVDGAYVREIFMPKGTLITSKIHKIKHPYFVMQGDCSVLTDEGVIRIKAPYYGITKPGTKRILYIHEDSIWVTVHVTKHKDLKDIEEEIIAKSFDEVDEIHEAQLTEENLKKLTQGG